MADAGATADIEVRFRVVVIERAPVLRRYCRILLAEDARFDVTTFSTVAEAVPHLGDLAPDAVVLGCRSQSDVLADIGAIRRAAPSTHVVLFATLVPTAPAPGVAAVLPKRRRGNLPNTVRSVLGLAHPDALDAVCPTCDGTLLVVSLSAETGEREVGCEACGRTFWLVGTRLHHSRFGP